MSTSLDSGRVLRIQLAGRPEKRDVLRRIISKSDNATLASIDAEGVLTAFLADDEGELDLASSVFASGMYPLKTEELGPVAGDGRYAS
jgi:hypothetical protein